MEDKKKDEKKDGKIIEEALQRFEDAEAGWSDNHEEALEDLRFARLGEQWPEQVKKERENASRPCLTINRLPAFIRQVVNDARQNTPSIRVHPVDDYADVDTAEVMNGIIRNIEAISNADQAYDNALEDAVSCGMGYFRITVDYSYDDAFDMDIKIERIANPLSVISDPYTMATDASDWTYCFVVDNMSEDAFKTTYPNADISSWDNDKQDSWMTEDSVRVAEYWTREEKEIELLLMSDGTTLHRDQYEENKEMFDVSGITIAKTRPSTTYKVMQYLMTSNEILKTTEWAGRLIPIIPVYGDDIIIENKRYFQSLVRQAKDSQRAFNYWRSSATEKVALATKAPWIGPVGFAENDVRKWESANTETHAFLEYDGPIPPQQTPPSMADAGAITEALNASDDLKSIMGIHDASLGARSNETSGRAIMARQHEGDVSTFHFIDNLNRGITYAGAVLLDLIPHVYDKPRVLRIMGYDGTPETVQVNQEFDANGMTKLHDLTKGKYDLVVSAEASYTTKRIETADHMMELLRSFPQAGPLVGDLVAKSLDFDGAEEWSKRLKTQLPPEIQAMEKMDGLPPEAQAAIAQSQQQIKQMTQFIEQGKQMLMEKDEQIKGLELEKKSKQDELMVKERDSKRKHSADMAKVEADKQIVAHKENEENRRMVISEATGFLQDYINRANQTQTENIGAQDRTIQAMLEQFDQQANVIKQIACEMEESETKTIEIQAPSGGVYKGVVNNDNIEIEAPSGAIYTGNITEH